MQAAKAGLTQAQQQMTATGAAAGKFSSFTQTAAMAMVGLNSAVMLGRQGLQVLGGLYEATAGRAAAYNKDIRETAINLGLSTEETSRIAQAMDDYGISISSVTTALEMMTKRGMQPSIENLAQLADQFVSIKDPVERAALMTEKLGRNWTTLTPMLSQGGDKFRQMAAGVEESLIVTAQSAAASEKFRVAVDGLQDSFEGLKISVGNGVIPTLTRFIDLISNMPSIVSAGAAPAVAIAKTYEGYVQAYQDAAKAQGFFIDKQGNLRDATMQIVKANYLATESQWKYTQSVGQLTDYEDTFIEIQNRRNQAEKEAVNAQSRRYAISQSALRMMGDQSFAERARAFSVEQTSRKMEELNLFMGGPVKKANEDYRKQLRSLQREMADTAAQIQKLRQQPWNKKELAEAESHYAEIQQQVADTGAEHRKASKQIIFDLAKQQLGWDGLTASEGEFLVGLADSSGLIDAETKKWYDSLKYPMSAFQDGKLTAQQTLDIITRLAQDWYINLHFMSMGEEIAFGNLPNGVGYGSGSGSGSGSGGSGSGSSSGGYGAGGGNPFIPGPKATGGPVLGGSPYLVGERGPELFVPAGNGEIVPTNQVSGGARVIQHITVRLSVPSAGFDTRTFLRELQRMGSNKA